MILRLRKSQSIIEYVGLVIIVSIALGAMALYVERGMNVRLRVLREELNEGQRQPEIIF